MEEKLKNAFEQIQMDDACMSRILRQKKNAKPVIYKIGKIATLIAACFALIFMLLTNAEVVNALETVIEKAQEVISKRASQEMPGGLIDEEYDFEGGAFHEEKGKLPDGSNYSAGSYLTGSKPSWLMPEEDGLYFVADGQQIRIDELISKETPFTYQYTDSEGIIHYIAVGLISDRWEYEWEGIGWAEWFQKAEEAKNNPLLSWIGGYCTAPYNPETGEDFLWLQNAKEIMGVPFP